MIMIFTVCYFLWLEKFNTMNSISFPIELQIQPLNSFNLGGYVKGNDDPGSQPAALDNLGVRLV
jgi:hypothetical protein